MKNKIVFAVAHAMTWFWTQACLASLRRSLASGLYDDYDCQIVVVDNSWDNSPSIRGITDTRLGEGVKVINNTAISLCHSAALDVAFDATWPMDYFVTIDSDAVLMRDDWLKQLLDRLRPTDYAVGDWHFQQWLYPSLALYRGEVVKAMADASKANTEEVMYWGERFARADHSPTGCLSLLQGPFSERRGWPPGTVLKETPSGQMRSPGHYEPGQQFHHWAVEAGYTYSVVPAITIRDQRRHIPLATFYGRDPHAPADYDAAVHDCWAIHFWGGTRALDLLNPRGGDLNDAAIVSNMAFWTEREAGWWRATVPEDIRQETLKLIKQHGWSFRPRPETWPQCLDTIKGWYKAGGVELA